jgi:hypothetical protein
MPVMENLNYAEATWSQVPSSDSFWEYTPDLEALYSSEYE